MHSRAIGLRNHIGRCCSVALIVVLGSGGATADQNPPPHSSTVLSAESSYPVMTPIVLSITITNNGDQSISYWTQGSPYPPGSWFSSTIKDNRGRITPVELSNEQDE